MSNVDPENVEKKFRTINNTQESIQSVSLWTIHHKAEHEKIVEIWFKVLKKSKMAHRLTLLYLCNDIVQNCKKKHAIVYKDAFKEILKDGTLFVRDSSIRPNVERIYKIWLERGVYDVEFIDEIIAILNNTKVRATQNSKLLAEFKPQRLIETITHFKRDEDETERKKRKLVNLKVDANSLEAIKQLKDRSHGNEFSQQFEDSCVHLEEYVVKLEAQIKSRALLVELLEQSEIYYDAQFMEAKIVTNAYKKFGSQVNSLRKKLEVHRGELPEGNDISSPVMDAPSPGATPPQEADNIETVDMDLSDDESQADASWRRAMHVSSSSSLREDTPAEGGSRSPMESDLLSRLGKLSKDNNFPWHVDSGGSSLSGDLPPPPVPLTEGDSTPVKDEGGGSTPVMDENDETANNTANPIEFLTQIINQSHKSSSSSSFFENLSQLTKTMSTQLAGTGTKKDEASVAGEVQLPEWITAQGPPPVPPVGPPPMPPVSAPPLPNSTQSDVGPGGGPMAQHTPTSARRNMSAPPPPLPPTPDFSKPPPMMTPPPHMPLGQPPFPPNFDPTLPPPMPPPPQNMGASPRLQVPPSPIAPGQDQPKWPPAPSMAASVNTSAAHYKPPPHSPLADVYGQQPGFPQGGYKPPCSSPSSSGGSVIPTLGAVSGKGTTQYPAPPPYGGGAPPSSHDKTLEKEQLEFIEKLKRKSPATPAASTSPRSLNLSATNLRSLTMEDTGDGHHSAILLKEGKHVPDGEGDGAVDCLMDMSESSEDEAGGKPISSVVVIKSGSLSGGEKDNGKKGDYGRERRDEDPGGYGHRRGEAGEHVPERRLSGGDRHDQYERRSAPERRDARDPYYDAYRNRDYYQQDRYAYDRPREYYREGAGGGGGGGGGYGTRAYPKRPPPPPPPPPPYQDRGSSYYPRY